MFVVYVLRFILYIAPSGEVSRGWTHANEVNMGWLTSDGSVSIEPPSVRCCCSVVGLVLARQLTWPGDPTNRSPCDGVVSMFVSYEGAAAAELDECPPAVTSNLKHTGFMIVQSTTNTGVNNSRQKLYPA